MVAREKTWEQSQTYPSLIMNVTPGIQIKHGDSLMAGGFIKFARSSFPKLELVNLNKDGDIDRPKSLGKHILIQS